MLSAITFDVWETLIHDPPEAEEVRVGLRARAMSSALRRRGIAVGEVALIEAYRAALPGMQSVWDGLRDFDTPDQVGYILRRLPPDVGNHVDAETVRELAQVYAQVVLDVPPELVSDAPAVLSDVAARGLRMGLICNTGRTPGWALRELLRRFGILHHFEVLAFSNEEGIRKPDAEIFRRVLIRLDAEAIAAAHVGDDAASDVLGAKRAGMRAVLVGCPAVPELPARPDAQVARLGDLPAVLDAWS